MNSIDKNTEIENGKGLLMTVWIFAALNYIYSDIIGRVDVVLLGKMASGQELPFPTTPEFWLAMAILIEIPIVMVLLTKVLKHPANRLANMIAGVFMTLVQAGSNFFGSAPTLQQIFFSVIEIAGTTFITVYAWKWRKSSARVEPAGRHSR